MAYPHTPDTCPSKHWNDGTDTCQDCGKDLNEDLVNVCTDVAMNEAVVGTPPPDLPSMRAYAPNGTPITGTKELVPGEATITMDSWQRVDGKIDFEYAGQTIPDWDNQRTVFKGGLIVFLDDNGDEWTEDQIELRADEPEDEEDDEGE